MPLDGTLYEDETLRNLRAARERISNKNNWCQGVLRKTTKDGTKQWCARGAIIAETGYRNTYADALLSRAAVQMGYGGPADCYNAHAVVFLNNTTDHLTTLAMFDLAIELRQAKIKETVLCL